ncbi:hypothetical protein CgunFtcFv8_008116 [Champsocephalus gunnari]|uniref:Uncharacterized protein n=1 Tax=Champsocephalus gunnari TaxID=52237 RepID=A0AAN8HFL7_CHAGU|nr:hypothetical protein CgunFtcFv8_008116 [Champsocephalus gunnari]
MSGLELLRELVTERLSAAAEEIFAAFKNTLAGYEEEIHRQRAELQTLNKIKIKKRSDQPQLALSEDFPSDQHQEEHCEQEWSSALDQEPPQTEKSQEEAEEEEDTIKVIFTPPCVNNKLDQDKADPLPSTSTVEAETEVEGRAYSGFSVVEKDNSGEEWADSGGSQSEDSDEDWRKRKAHRPMVLKLHPDAAFNSSVIVPLAGTAVMTTPKM